MQYLTIQKAAQTIWTWQRFTETIKLDDALQQIDWVKANPSSMKTFVIDTIDWAEMLCIESICAQHGKKGIEDFGYGNGYMYVKEEFGRFLNKLSDVIEIGINVVLTAHGQIVKFEQPDEMGAYDRYQLKLGKKTSSQTAPLVKEWADMVLFMNYKTFSVATDDKGKKHKGQGGVEPSMLITILHGMLKIVMDYLMSSQWITHILLIFLMMHHKRKSTASQPDTDLVQTTTLSANTTTTRQQPIQETKNNQVVEQSPVQNAPPVTNTVELNPMIPQSLRDLMMQNGVSEEEIQIVVSNKGYYPMGTPILNYDPGFIDGVLVGAWQQVYGMVLSLEIVCHS